ncbi:MAG: metallophosphoesterase, partial [Verrucomicrobiota bacterium]
MSKTYVVSDLHLGHPCFQRKLFEEFLTHLPEQFTLVLNGDTIDSPGQELPAEDKALLLKLASLSEEDGKDIIILNGNHDESIELPENGNIEIAEFWVLAESGTLITHGASFDNVMPYNRWFLQLFKALHRLRIWLGCKPVHVAEYAKKWKPLYNYLRRTVRNNAIEHALENGWTTVICGHLHCPEIYQSQEVCYINTGSWTES